jgi:chromate reductase
MLFFAGALRTDSSNKKFVREAARLAGEAGIKSDYIDIKDYPMPLYDGDIEAASGVPETTKKLGEKIRAADALVISTPEYNASISAVLKNIIDWLSREKQISLTDKYLLLLAASPGALGGIRGLCQARQPFEALGVYVFPGMMNLPKSNEAFDAQHRLKDEKTTERLKKLLEQFAKHVGG